VSASARLSGSGARERAALRTGLAVSGVIHVAIVAVFGWMAWQHEAPHPPVYRVELIAAPSGTRQAGVVSPDATTATKAADAPSGAERKPAEKSVTSKKSTAPVAKATPTPSRSKAAGAKAAVEKSAKAAPKAGAGRESGKGADVANVDLKGIAFPFPGYVNNIVRQLTIAYSPRRTSAALVAEVRFSIRRDGSVANIEVVRSSGDRLFDLEARGTVESVGASRSFGSLPTGWADDVLIVYFTFDYALRPS
jgi:protein TonB